MRNNLHVVQVINARCNLLHSAGIWTRSDKTCFLIVLYSWPLYLTYLYLAQCRNTSYAGACYRAHGLGQQNAEQKHIHSTHEICCVSSSHLQPEVCLWVLYHNIFLSETSICEMEPKKRVKFQFHLRYHTQKITFSLTFT